MTALGVSIAILAIWWFSRPVKPLTTSEWLERMRKHSLGVTKKGKSEGGMYGKSSDNPATPQS